MRNITSYYVTLIMHGRVKVKQTDQGLLFFFLNIKNAGLWALEIVFELKIHRFKNINP